MCSTTLRTVISSEHGKEQEPMNFELPPRSLLGVSSSYCVKNY